jgi:hypothetical protein
VIPPVVVVAAFRVGWIVIAAGAAAWIAAVGVKLAVARATGLALLPASPASAALQGFWSATSELGAAAMVFQWWLSDLTVAETLGFGFGAASIEIVALHIVGVVRGIRNPSLERRQEWQAGAARSLVVRHIFAVERLAAALVHVGSRGLIYLAITEHRLAFAVLAVTLFAAVDGVAVFGKAAKWKWLDPRVAWRFYMFVFALGCMQLGSYLTAVR